MGLFAQNYNTLWKQVEEADLKDLPKTAIERLQQIEDKARKEKAYGHLLRATLLHARKQAEIAPDSLQPAIAQLEQQERQADDAVLRMVYAAVLAKIYKDNHQLADDWEARQQEYYQRATEHPELLAAEKADTYVPFVVKGKDSGLYGHDLLSVVGTELEAWQWMSDYYAGQGNRAAACLTALRHQTAQDRAYREKLAQSVYISKLDSLITVYGDLPEAGEIAIERYIYMLNHTDATPAEKADWLQQSLKRWSGWQRANELRNFLTELTNPAFQVRADVRVAEINKEQTVRLDGLRHVSSLTMRVYRTALKGDTDLNPNDERDYKKIKAAMAEVKDMERVLTFSGHENYEVFEDSLLLGKLSAGVYLLEFSTQPATSTYRTLYFVSGVRLMAQPQPDNKVRYVVVDATTGQPLPGATIQLVYRGMKQSSETKTCDAKGEVVCTFDKQRPSAVWAYTKSDNYCPQAAIYGRYVYYEQRYNREYTNIFTDRSIYRPGQTVHVAAVVWKDLSATENTAVEGKTLKLELRDTNYKLVGEQQVVTDRFGKCSADFTLPTGLLNGRFTIRGGQGMATIRVEEYKRPTFEVKFDDYKESYKNGDIVHAKAKATTYAGVPVQDAKVKYTVRRQVAWWWLGYSRYWQVGVVGNSLQNEVVSEGETVTADDGSFTVDMPMQLPKSLEGRPMFYHFVVEADVTDMGGETHSGTMRLPLGTKPTVLTCDLPKQVRGDQLPKVTFSRRNAAGKEIDGTVKYRIDGGKWQECAANAPCSMAGYQLKSGEHRIEATCGDDTVDMTFVVFGLNDTKPATKTSDWFYVSDKQFPSDGKPVTVQVGASDPNLHIVYGIFAGSQQIESGSVRKNGELLNRKFTWKEAYGNGLLLTFAWVKDGVCHSHETVITRPLPDKQLKMAWETFRDRLKPGQQEEWRLQVTTPDGQPADASLMAVLYDKSLDQLNPHQWTFSPVPSFSLPSARWQWNTWGSINGSGAKDYRLLDVAELDYSCFDGEVFPYYISPMRMRGGMMYKSMAAPMMSRATNAEESMTMDAANGAVQKAVVVEEKKVATTGAVAADEAVEADGASERDGSEVQLRENLNEMAFCYPTVESDKDGRIVLKFTLPESLTTWRFMGVANTSDMLYGSIDGEAVAQKDVMVQPNMPRFVRIGDKAQLSARIFNLLETPVSGQARLQLIDPENDKTVYEQTIPFSVEGGKTTSVTADFTLTGKESSLLVCRVTAAGDGFSDGEQHYLPVLPNSEYVTKTVPYTQHEPGVKTIDLTRLFPAGTTHQKLTVEYTNNPAWLMVQSLPVLGQPYEHSAIDQAASYYSNLLAKTLLAQSPQVKTVFEQWKREGGSENSMTSNLQKNQELKNIVLSETPWVWAADRENEQKARLSDFFDENGIGNRLSTAVEKLRKLQNGDGSFSWFPGMEGSTSITVAVAEMLARLNVMAGTQKDIKTLEDKAFGFIGNEMVKVVAELKKQKKPSFPSFTALRWLYICAIDGRQLPSRVKAANDYLIPLLKKDIKRQTIYEKAMTAVILAKRGEQKVAANYVKSLKEYTVYTEEMGRYYDTPRAAYSWYDYRIPTEVAAIEAIKTVAPQDEQTIDEMRRWLLQEKRTQLWDTPINSVNAIYAFLFDHHDLLAQREQTVLAIDGSPLDTPKATAGIGYVKTAISQPKGQTFTADKRSEGTSWGAVYAQFMQKTSDVEASQSGITVKRELMTRNGNALSPAGNAPLKVGDRVVVRITIDCDRDLDFVQVSDRRAACMEPVRQLSGYRNGAYCSPKDCATNYFYYGLAKGRHVMETEYYIDRAGQYETGTCSVQCAYSPEYRGTAPSMTIEVKQ
jgi:hypothetical protein